MFYELIVNELCDKKVVDHLAVSFYGDELPEGRNYYINEQTGLNYFGEYLERHERAALTPETIMGAVVYRNNQKLEGYQIYDGQLEGFIDKVEKILEEDSTNNFKRKLLYLMFLQKLDKGELFDKILKEILENMQMDNDFLVFTAMVHYNYLKIDTKTRKKIVQMMTENKFKLDLNSIKKRSSFGYRTLTFNTELPALKIVFKAYDLKKSEFKDHMDKFEAYKNLRKFGTKDGLYELYESVIDINKQDFYFMSLKTANETYAEGSAMVKANIAIIDMLSENIDINDELSELLPRLSIRVAGGYNRNLFDYSNVDFSNVNVESFKNVVKLYNNDALGVSYVSAKELFETEDFADYILSLKDSYSSYMIKKISMDVIRFSENKEITEKYYEAIKDIGNLNMSDMVTICKAGFIPIESVCSDIFYEIREGVYGTNTSLRNFVDTCLDNNLVEVLIQVFSKIVEENIVIGSTWWRTQTLTSAVSKIRTYAKNLDDENNEKKNIYKILNNFVYIYLSAKYFSFIIENIEDEVFKEAVGISEEDIKEIGEYLIAKEYVSSSSVSDKVKRLIYSEEDIVIEKCKATIDNYISDTINHGYYYENNKVVELISTVENKEKVAEYYIEKASSLKNDYDGNATFMNSISVMMKLNLISEEDAINTIKDRVLKMAE